LFKPDADPSHPGAPTFTSDVHLVRMLATVRDAAGGIAGKLTRGDFTIQDDSVDQEISIFEATTEQPLSVAVLIDCSASTRRAHRTELDSVRAFVQSLFKSGNPEDSASLYSFNADVTQEAAWTRAVDRFDRALGRLESDGATALYDAIRLASEDLALRGGRHVVIIVSDGGDTFSRTTFHQALEAAHIADVVVYSVVIVPVAEEAGRNVGGENALYSLSTSTGGRTFSPGTSHEMDEAFSEILRELRTQYLIGYYTRGIQHTPDRFHEVKVAVKQPGFTVSTRRGYYDPPASKGFRRATR
jgi:Ca-activated chloride channel family protein